MIKVLVADDQELIRNSLTIILNSRKNIQVTEAVENGQAVIVSARKNRPDVILMDVRMPKMDGVQCTKIIKANYPDVKIIILSTFDDDEYIYNALKFGADGYLLKGDSMNEIVAAIWDVYNGKAVINQDVTNKVVKLFSKMAKADYAWQVDEKSIKGLSKTEWKIIQEIGCGASNKEISEKLHLSEGTIRNYLSAILNKLELRDRTQLAIWTIQSQNKPKPFD